MGKIKNNKRSHANVQDNPTGLPSLKTLAKEISADDRLGIETVIEKLNSADADDREYGCTALGMYISNPNILAELLDKNIVRIVTPLLQDNTASVQWAASVVIRGISEEGGFEACERMIRQDVITGVGAYIRNQLTTWKQAVQDGKTDRHTNGFVNCIYTVQNLCECSALAVRMSIEDSIPQALLACLKNDSFSPVVLLATAQCLYTMSEENETVTELLKLDDSQQVIQAIICNEKMSIYTRVVLVGVQFSTFGMLLLSPSGTTALNALLQALQTDTYQQVCATIDACVTADSGCKVPPQVDSVHMDGDERDDKVKSNTERDLRKELESLDNLISAQKLSFEIFTNVLGGDDTDEWADMEDDDTSSCGTGADTTEYMEDEEDLQVNSSTATSLAEKGLVRLLGERLHFVEAKVYNSVDSCDKTHREPLKSTIQGYDSMLTSALLCLNNTVPQVKVDQFGGLDSLHSTMKLLLASLTVSQVSSQESLVESITSAVRSIVEQLTKHAHTVSLDEKELDTLQKLTHTTHTATAVNAVRCITAVGMSVCKEAGHPLVKVAGTILIDIATTSKELWLVIESLDAIMDVFSDDCNNSFLSQLGVIPTLSHILPQLKTMVAKRDKMNDHFLPVLSTVRANLPRFIKYKNKVM